MQGGWKAMHRVATWWVQSMSGGRCNMHHQRLGFPFTSFLCYWRITVQLQPSAPGPSHNTLEMPPRKKNKILLWWMGPPPVHTGLGGGALVLFGPHRGGGGQFWEEDRRIHIFSHRKFPRRLPNGPLSKKYISMHNIFFLKEKMKQQKETKKVEEMKMRKQANHTNQLN